MSDTRKSSYGQMLKSSALIGGSSALTVLLGIVRAKGLAILLGPAGIGLLGIYSSISDLVRSLAGMGVNSSGVRDIAEAVGTGDSRRIAITVTTLRRVAVFFGALGALLLLVFSKTVSRWSFGDEHHAEMVALLALAVFFSDVSAGQGALLQGMRRIADLARMNVLGALFGTVFGIAIVYFMGTKGVVPSIVCVAAMSVVTSWWYARKVKVERVSLTLRQVASEASGLLKLGVVFMSSGLLTMGMAFLIRSLILRDLGEAAAGHYQAAWTLGGVYIAFVLQAMSTDFYPRLTAAAHDNTECNRLVNEQIEVGLLLAGTAVAAALTFAPLAMQVFYTNQFEPAEGVFRWICLGMMIRVASWPMGFIIVAKGERALFFWVEVLSNAAYAALVWLGLKRFQLEGAGMAFFGLYVLNSVGLYFVARRLSGFRLSSANRKLLLLYVPLVTAVFAANKLLPRAVAVTFGVTVTVLVGIYSLRTLCALVPLERFPGPARRALALFKLAPSSGNV